MSDEKKEKVADNEPSNQEALSVASEDKDPEPEEAIHPPKVESWHEWLGKNKIFFETVAATLLSLMAIIISVAQIILGVKQTTLTQVQTEVARQQALPQFVVNWSQTFDTKEQKYTGESINITNQGGIVHDFDSDEAVFFDVVYLPKGGTMKKVEVPVDGYYNAGFHTGQGTGQILRIEGIGNAAKRQQLEDELRQLASSNNAIANMDVRRYVRLTYQDIFGTKHKKFYFVPVIHGSRILDQTEGESIFSQYEKARKELITVYFDSLDSKKLFSLVTS
jgi:hypothetical protein